MSAVTLLNIPRDSNDERLADVDTTSFMPSLISRPCPAFRHFQYGKAGEGLVSVLM